MGLDTTHNAWHGPYSSFGRFRERLAQEIGINLNNYIGYNPHANLKESEIDHPLMDLFNHSDCDGELTPMQCWKIAKGLDEVIKKLPVPEDGDSWDARFIESCIQFRDGCMLAFSKNEVMEFC
jgi:hypothetical protein